MQQRWEVSAPFSCPSDRCLLNDSRFQRNFVAHIRHLDETFDFDSDEELLGFAVSLHPENFFSYSPPTSLYHVALGLALYLYRQRHPRRKFSRRKRIRPCEI